MGLLSGYTKEELEAVDIELKELVFEPDTPVNFLCKTVELDEQYSKLVLNCDVLDGPHKGELYEVKVTLEHQKKFLRNIERQFTKEFFKPEEVTDCQPDLTTLNGVKFAAIPLEVYESTSQKTGKTYKNQTWNEFKLVDRVNVDDIPF